MQRGAIVLGAACAAALGTIVCFVYPALWLSAPGAAVVASAANLLDQRPPVRKRASRRGAAPETKLSSAERQKLWGIVRDRSNRVVATATVCWSQRLRDCCEPAQCESVDAEGQFEVREAAAAPRWLVASAPGYASTSRQVSNEFASPISVILAARTGSGLSGHVLDASGGPVAGATVSAGSESEAVGVSNALTDDAGHFDLDAADGDWLLTARADGYAPSYRRSSAPADDITLHVAPGSSIQGGVQCRDVGAPLPGALVHLVGADGVLVPGSLVRADELGRFAFESLGAGSYQLQVRSPGWRSDAAVVALGMADSEDVLITAAPAGSVRGVISLGEAACESGRLQLDGVESLLGVTGPGGVVEVEGVLPGSYAATVECVGAAPLRQRVEVRAEPLHRDWQLLPGLILAGAALDASGHPLAGAQIMVEPNRESLGSSVEQLHDVDLATQTSSTCVSDASGEFACFGLQPGDYRCGLIGADHGLSDTALTVSLAPDVETHVVLRAPGQGTLRVGVVGEGASRFQVFATSSAWPRPVVGSRVGANWVFAPLELGEYRVLLGDPDEPALPPTSVRLSRSGELLDIELVPPRSLTISGMLVTAEGDAVADAIVELVPRQQAVYSSSESVFSDAQGRFVLDGLLPGRYSLWARSPIGEVTAPDLVAGSADVSLRLTRYGALSGSVRFRGGPAEPFVLHYARVGPDEGEVAVPMGPGDWHLPRLMPGRYRLQARSRIQDSDLQEIAVDPGADTNVELELHARDSGNLASAHPAASDVAPQLLSASAAPPPVGEQVGLPAAAAQ